MGRIDLRNRCAGENMHVNGRGGGEHGTEHCRGGVTREEFDVPLVCNRRHEEEKWCGR